MVSTDYRPPLRIAVLAGGDSAERAVSLRSGNGVAAALVSAGHAVTLIDPAECALEQLDWSPYDACFLALHGGPGEDGTVQRALARLGVPYTGSGPEACRLAMSKSASKRRFVERGVATPAFVIVGPAEPYIAGCVTQLGFPLVIKPDCQGSSIGVSLVEQAAQLADAVEEARRHAPTCLAEAFIEGREFTVAILGERPLPTIEIVSTERLFSYNAKYTSPRTKYLFDFQLPEATHGQIEQTAVAAAHALGTSGLVRVDLMLDGNGRSWVLEVNTTPGLTARSLAPQAAERAGLSMETLCDQLIRQCLATAEVS
jgi:D-alanine-D-alanine ligase